MKRKTRITKEEVIRRREEKKNYSSYKAKKETKPGSWTNVEPTYTTKALLRPTKSFISLIPDFFGSYVDKAWNEKGWYPIIFNVYSDDQLELITKHGLDSFMAAIEVSLNKQGTYGDIVILSIYSPNAQNPDQTKRFISCEAKTNKKSIKGFTAIRSNKYIIL